jgi:hypothetical protein
MYYYNPDKDRSEQCGWRKVCDEKSPTDSEQNFWGVVTAAFAGFVSIITVVFL